MAADGASGAREHIPTNLRLLLIAEEVARAGVLGSYGDLAQQVDLS